MHVARLVRIIDAEIVRLQIAKTMLAGQASVLFSNPSGKSQKAVRKLRRLALKSKSKQNRVKKS
jgi:hypothetical protein